MGTLNCDALCLKGQQPGEHFRGSAADRMLIGESYAREG